MPSDDVATKFVGSWSLMSWTLTALDGRIEFPYGEDAVGCIMYTPEGRMAEHLMRANVISSVRITGGNRHPRSGRRHFSIISPTAGRIRCSRMQGR